MMKNATKWTLVFIFIAVFSGYAQIKSTLQGGPWNSPSTWINNVPPGPNDDVIIQGPVSLDVITNAGSVQIDAGGKLSPQIVSSTIYKLYVNKYVWNFGTISGSNLQIQLGGSLYNTGNWESNSVIFPDTLSHPFKALPGFSPLEVRADSATLVSSGDIYLDSLSIFAHKIVLGNNLSNEKFTLDHHSALYVDEFVSVSDTNDIEFLNGSYVGGHVSSGIVPRFTDVTFRGTVQMNSNIILSGNSILKGAMFPHLFNNPLITVEGDFTNNGQVIANGSGWLLNFDVSGNLTNNGPWNSASVNFTGTGQHLIATDPNFQFSPLNLNAATSTLLAGSLIRFDGVTANIQTLVLQNNYALFLNSGTSLSVDQLTGNGNTIQLLGSSYLANSVSGGGLLPTYSNVALDGQVEIGSNIIFTGNVILNGNMYPHFFANPMVTVQGNFTNNGQVQANGSGWLLNLILAGDVVNNGKWNSASTRIAGMVNQNIALRDTSTIDHVQMDAKVSGSSFQWLKNGVPISGATSSSYSVAQLALADSGIYQAKIDNGANFSREIRVVSSGNFLATPILVSPANGADSVAQNVRMAWHPVAGASSYRLEINTDASFGSATVVLDSSAIADTSVTFHASQPGLFYWRVTATGANGQTSLASNVYHFRVRTVTAIKPDKEQAVPQRYEVAQNYPNPFNPETTIRYQLPRSGHVTLIIYNMLGQKIRTLVNGRQPAGTYRVKWNGRDDAGRQAASGIYFYKLQAENFRQVRKMILMR